MGGLHLYQFCLGAKRLGSWELSASSPDVALAALQLRKGARFTHEYDLSIPWRHEVRVEAHLPAEPGKAHPICTGSDGACYPRTAAGRAATSPVWIVTRPTGNMLPAGTTSGAPQVLLAHHLKQLKLPTCCAGMIRSRASAPADGVDHPRYLLRLIDRERRTVKQRIRPARFPAVMSFDTFDFTAIPGLNKMLVLELARREYVLRRENAIALGNSGAGKTHVGLALGLAACQRGVSVAFTTSASLVNQLLDARDERRLLKLQRDLQAVKLLVVDA